MHSCTCAYIALSNPAWPQICQSTGKKTILFINAFNYCCLPHEEYLMKKNKVWEAVAWLRAGKGPLVSLSHEPCPSQCGDILNHTVGTWPCPWRASTLFSLHSPCDGIIPAHLPSMKPIPGNTGTHSALLDPIVMLNGVYPHIYQVQMFVGWHCAGSGVDRVENTPPHHWWIQQCSPLNQWKCGSWSVRWAGVCIKVAEALAHFPFPRSCQGWCFLQHSWSMEYFNSKHVTHSVTGLLTWMNPCLHLGDHTPWVLVRCLPPVLPSSLKRHLHIL